MISLSFKYLSLAALMLILCPSVMAGDRAEEEIDWQVISEGGSMNAGSTNYRLSRTVSQTAVGIGSSAPTGRDAAIMPVMPATMMFLTSLI